MTNNISALVLYKKHNKFILKLSDNVIAHLERNDFTESLEPNDRISLQPSSIEKRDGRADLYCVNESNLINVLKKQAKQQNPSSSSKKEAQEAYRKNRFMVAEVRRDSFQVGSLIELRDHIVRVTKVGKTFNFVKKENSKSKLKNNDKVCYVYYTPTLPTPIDFFEGMVALYSTIQLIKSDGIKPRHSVAEVGAIKAAKVICDSRKKIDGNSWIAYNDEFVWYVNHKLSAISIENNIKINGEMAQCWRIPKWKIQAELESLKNTDVIVFKSKIIPPLNPIINDDDDE